MVLTTSQSGEGQSLPIVRSSLQLSTSRQSLTGALGGASQKRLGTTGGPSSNHRTSSPGVLLGVGNVGGSSSSGGSGVGGNISPTFAAHGSLSTSPYLEMPRLPAVSESGSGGEKPNTRPSANVMLRRASTIATLNVGQQLPPSDASPIKERDRERESPLGDSIYTLKKERNALRMDKNFLLLNKRRLESLLTKLLEQPLPGEETDFGGMDQQQQPPESRSGSPVVLRASSTRAQVLKVLDESTSLDKQLLAGPGATAAAFEAEVARSLDLSAKVSEMQAEHEIAISRLEGELSYRHTQAAAATANLQKQLNEAQEELSRAKQQLAGADAQIRELSQQSAELRKQVHNMSNTLAEKSKMLAETRDMLGLDKSTMATIIEMLKEQLREASVDRAAKNRLITELEYAIVHRDTLLTEAHERMNQAAAQAAAAAAAGVSSSAAVARVAASMQAPLDSKSSWGLRASRGSHARGPLPPSPRISGAGNGPHGGGGGGGGAATAGISVAGKGRSATHGGALSEEEDYSGELFESTADIMN